MGFSWQKLAFITLSAFTLGAFNQILDVVQKLNILLLV